MNVKTFFIAAILSLASFPLCAQAESTIPSDGQLGYETGTVDTLEYGVTDYIDKFYENEQKRIKIEDERRKRLQKRYEDLGKQIDNCMQEIFNITDQISEENDKEKPDSNKIERLKQRINSLNRRIRSLESQRDMIVF